MNGTKNLFTNQAAYGRVRARSTLTMGKGKALGAIAVLGAVGALLGGCALDPERARGASQEYAGIADYRITPIFAEGATEPAYRIEIRNGKEVGKLKLRAYKLESGEVQIELDQEDTRAFEGQRISAKAVVQIAQDLSRELRETVGLSAEAAGPIVLRLLEGLLAP